MAVDIIALGIAHDTIGYHTEDDYFFEFTGHYFIMDTSCAVTSSRLRIGGGGGVPACFTLVTVGHVLALERGQPRVGYLLVFFLLFLTGILFILL